MYVARDPGGEASMGIEAGHQQRWTKKAQMREKVWHAGAQEEREARYQWERETGSRHPDERGDRC